LQRVGRGKKNRLGKRLRLHSEDEGRGIVKRWKGGFLGKKFTSS